MSFLDTFSAALPHEIRLEDLKLLVPSQWWHDQPEQAAVSALCRCGKFDTQDYLERYPHVAQEGIDPVLHYVQHGIAEKKYFKCLPDITLGQSKVRLAYQYFQKGEHEKALQLYEELSEQMGSKNFAANIALCKKKLGSKESLPALAKEISKPKPKVSVLIPVYNNAQYLHECIDSVINQTLKEIEIIIINDGSTDPEAVKILNDYAARDNRIKLIHKENTGYGHSMNVGLDNATGEYIGIVESDDYILKNMYEMYYKIAKENKLDFVKSDAKMFYGDKKDKLYKYRAICDDDSKYNKVLDPWIDLTVFNIHNVIWNGIYSHKFIKINNIRFNETPGASYQDNGFWFQTIMYTHNFMIIKEPMYMLRRDNAGSSIFSKEKIFCMCDEYKYIYNILKKSKKYYNRFIKIYQYKKYKNYIFTLNRIDKRYRNQLLSRIAEEFKESFDKNEIDKNIFGKSYSGILKIIEGTYGCEWMEHPEVSIVIAVYNNEKYIKYCLNSLKDQTFKNIEIICIDDGSTDKTNKILREYASNDLRFKIFRQTNKGAGAARNTGFSYATGDYIMFLDSDDYFEKEMIDELLKIIKKDDSDLCVFRSKRYFQSSEKIEKIDWTIKKELLPNKQTFSPCEIKKEIFKVFNGWAWDKIYKRAFLIDNNLKFQEIYSSNDLVFTFMSVIKARKITICEKYFITQRYTGENSISTTREKNFLCFWEALRMLKRKLIECNRFEQYQSDFISYCIHAFFWNVSTLKGIAAIQLYKMRNEFINEFKIDEKYNNKEFKKIITI